MLRANLPISTVLLVAFICVRPYVAALAECTLSSRDAAQVTAGEKILAHEAGYTACEAAPAFLRTIKLPTSRATLERILGTAGFEMPIEYGDSLKTLRLQWYGPHSVWIAYLDPAGETIARLSALSPEHQEIEATPGGVRARN